MAAPTTIRKDVRVEDVATPLQHVFSQAIVTKKKVYCSGSIGLDKDTGKLVDGGIQAQTTQVLKNLRAVLKAAGSDFSKVIKANVYIRSFDDFAAMNEVYVKHFDLPMPARTCVAVAALPFDALVEIECIALL